MGTYNKEFKIALDIQAKIGKASDQISNLKKQIDNFELSKGLASEFAKEFKNIEHDLAELQRKTASGEVNLIDAKSAEKEIDKIEKRWAFLVSKIGGDGFLEKGLKSDAQAMAALEALTKSYASGIKEAEAQEAKLNKKLEEAKQKQKELTEAQKEQKVVKASELEDQKAQLAILEKQERAAKKARDDAEKALRAKVDGSNGKYNMSQVSQKGSPLRKTDAYRTFREAQSTYESTKTATKTQKTNVESMTTKQMQAAEATAAKEAIDKATEALENYRKTTLATAKEDAFKNAKESLKSIAEFKDVDWDGLGISLSEIKSVEELEEALAKLRTEAGDRANGAIKEMETTTKDAGQGFQALGRDVKNAEKHLEEIDEQARRTEAFEARIKQFLGMAGAVELLRRALRQAFETTKELDAAMTEMAVVTNLDVGDYWDQLPDHTKRASELGVAIKDVYEAETLYYQQGLKTTDAQALANTTLKMARIAGLDAAEATDKMTAALRGFNMELDEASAEKVADVYSELAAITAADVNEISSAMTKTASIASAAGMEFETTAAFLSQIIETTRESAETAGTAMKTVIARFSEVKKLQNEGIVNGEDSEGEVIDVNKIQTALRTVGISMDEFFQGTEGLDSVFLKLAERWDTLDVKTQRYIATTAAGSRQQSRFIAMMSDYARTQELMTAANDSAGASQEQYEKTLESIESKLAKLKNAWDEFSMGILESDLVKVGVDILTKFLEIINKATSAFNGLGGSVMKIMTVVSLFKLGQKVFEKFKTPLMQFFADIIKMSHDTGYQSGKAFLDGEKQAKEEETQSDFQNKLDNAMSKESPTALQKLKKISGKQSYDDGKQLLQSDETQALESKWQELSYGNTENKPLKRKKAIAQARQQKVNRVKETEDKLMAMETDGKTDKNSDEYLKIKSDVDKAQKELVEFDETQLAVQENAQKGWSQVGQGIQQMGNSVSAVGIGVSMLGGIFQSLGLEEVGEGFAWVGNVITILGGGISFIGTLVPIVTKILVASGYSIQGAFWPILVIGLALAALVGTILAIITIIKSVQAAKLENRMAAAAEATEEAKNAAEEAKQAYDDLLSGREEYDEMQKTLEDLAYGTKEWKEALHEVNQQVLNLISTYPELAKYLNRGSDGQLVIADEGWNALIEKQQKTVANTQSTILSRQMDEQKLKIEDQASAYTRATTVYTNSDGYSYTNEKANPDSIWNDSKNAYLTEGLRDALEEIYITQNSSLEEQPEKIAELAQQFRLTEDAIRGAGEALAKDKDTLIAIADQTENIARASLTTLASEDVINSDYGDEIIDSFAQSVDNDYEQQQKEEKAQNIRSAYINGKVGDDENFKALAKEYDVNLESGNDKQNLRELYAAMTGKSFEEVKDSGLSKAELADAIAEMQVNSERTDKMDEYLKLLTQLSKEDADQISSIFSDDGRGMTREFASELMTGMDKNGEGGTLSEDAMREQAEKLGFTGEDAIKKWAEALGKTEEELKNEAEENARKAVKTNTKTFANLNRVLGEADEEITRFGNDVSITTENSANLATKLIGATQIAGEEGGNTLKTLLDNALNAAGPKAEQFASILSDMNWNSADEWEKLPEILDSLGIDKTNQAFKDLIDAVNNFNVAVKIIDIDSLSEKIQDLNDLIKSLQTGEQGRVFDEDTYQKLITADETLADQFVQIGSQFHYLGTSMTALEDALYQSMYEQVQWGATQLKLETKIAEAASAFDKTIKDKDITTTEDKVAYLEKFRESAKESGVESLQFLTDESGQSVGLSFGTDLSQIGDATVDKYYSAVQRAIDRYDSGALEEETGKKASEARVALYTGSNILTNINRSRDEEQSEESRNEYRKAISIQASESGNVAEAVISRYNDLIDKDAEERTASEKAELESLEDTIAEGVNRTVAQLQQLQTINSETQKVAQALQTIGQSEIDKLSNINSSINESNQAMLDKLQAQINENRKQRQNEKAQESIANKQSQLAYLMADSSGAGALDAQALKEQIAAEQESYQDNLIDQSLQKLSDDNAAAAQQRERQIALMEAQLQSALDSGELMKRAEEITVSSLQAINDGISPLATQLYEILAAEERIKGGMATDSMVEEFQYNFLSDATGSANALLSLQDNISTEDQINKDQLTEQQAIKNAADAIYTYLYGGKNENGDEVQGLYAREEAQRQATKEKETARADAISAAVETAAKGTNIAGESLKSDEAYINAYTTYKENGGLLEEEAFYNEVMTQAKEYYDWYGVPSGSVAYSGLNNKKGTKLNLTIGDYEDLYVELGDSHKDTSRLDELYQATTNTEAGKGSVLFDRADEKIYIKTEKGSWFQVVNSGEKGQTRGTIPANLTREARESVPELKKFKTGGVADFTGPAWLDGTKSRPELILNARDTQNFIQLKDILSEVMDKGGMSDNSTSNGDNYFDIQINVEDISDDYDVEQLANKIRSMIYEDATYRNVNAVSHISR